MTVVGILGVVHNDELRIRHHLTLDIIKELILDFDPDVIQRIKNAIKDNANARILCIVGADHNHALYEGLQSVHNIQIRYPLK